MRFRIAVCVVATALLSATPAAHAAPGALDPTFGSGGLATLDDPLQTNDELRAVAIAPGGKPVVAGKGGGLALVGRLTPAGAPDPSFGGSGLVEVDLAGAVNSANGVGVLPDGRIVIAGLAQGLTDAFGFARLNPNGSLDTSFNGSGTQILDPTANGDEGFAMALQPDGKIVAVGRIDTFKSAIVRLDVNGQPDSSFDGDGILPIDVSPTAVDELHAVAIQPDGKIVAGGFAAAGDELSLLRVDQNGNLDPSFNGGSPLTTNLTGSGSPSQELLGLAVQADGRIVAVGDAENQGLLVRFTAAGALDSSFNGSGFALTPAGPSNRLGGVAVQGDGSIVAAGVAAGPSGILMRRLPDGQPDTGFGSAGTTSVPGSPNAVLSGVALQADQKAVAAGASGSVTSTGIVARTEGDVADLSLASVAPTPISPGRGKKATFKLTLKNGGPQAARSGTVAISPQAGTELVSTSFGSSPCPGGNCNFSSLAAGATATVDVTLKQSNSGPPSFSARATSATFDPSPSDAAVTFAGRPSLGLKLGKKLRKRRLFVTAEVNTKATVKLVATAGKGKRKKTIARKTVGFGTAQKKTVRIKLSKTGRRAFASKRKLRLSLAATVIDSTGQTTTKTISKKVRR